MFHVKHFYAFSRAAILLSKPEIEIATLLFACCACVTSATDLLTLSVALFAFVKAVLASVAAFVATVTAVVALPSCS